MKRNVFILLLGIVLFSCSEKTVVEKPVPTDAKATPETVKLYQNLMELKNTGLMFGHQDDLAYGHTWYGEAGDSDVKAVCGDYPAVYGSELGHLELGVEYSLDSVYFDDIRKYIQTAYERGGVNTISWHLNNPLTGGTSWDVSSKEVVASILPGGEKHELFVDYLDHLAAFLESLKTADGTYIPILFRPYHEHTGSWFWWGKDLCTVDDYKALWRFTVNYLQNTKNLHHLLYTYSTDRFQTKEDYLERYPGDDIIDILGFDLYDYGPDYTELLNNCAKNVTELAAEKGKIPTVSETGGPIARDSTWWTEKVLNTLKPYDLLYALVWRNPFKHTDHEAFGPYPGSNDAADFVKFYNDPKTLFQADITAKNLYK